MLESILYRVDIQDMLVKRPRRNDDLQSYYDLDMFIIIYIYFVHDYSVYIYILLVFKYAFYMVFCAACLAFLCENSVVCLLCHDVAEVAHCLLNTTNIPSWG